MKDKFEGLVDDLLAGGFFLEEAIELLEKTMIQRSLERTSGNQSAASKQLGIHRNTLQRKMLAYAIGNRRSRGPRKPAVRETSPSRRKRSAV
jgi:Fis family transcriptional regulator, factor for inversion stimulation protein